MRLLNTTTFEVQFFATERLAPKYAILSHRWEEQEVVFRDLCNEIVNDDHVYRMKENGTKKGYYKLYKACEQARSDAIDWIWVDTCCIDKSDNNELSEAINSMFRWYEKAVICYVFLCDVDAVHAESFGSSKWFRRGWTLQELLAPKKAIFYDALWQPIGTKQTLSLFIEEVTGIPGFVLTDSKWIKVQSIAKRMSWVSRRSTTRPEDIAYCLLGIFDVNMDLRYGEREKAFTRLQEEILRRNGQIDQSILAWSDSRRHYAGSLAPSPAAFRCCGRTQSWPSHEAIEVTHRGVKSSFDIAPVTLYTYIARLGCRDSDDDAHGDICLCLRHIPGTNEYIRISMHGTDRPQTKSKAYKFRLHKDITILHHNNIDKRMIGSAPGPSQSASSMIDSSFGFSVLPMSIAMGSEVDIATANTRIGAQSKGTSLIVESGFECSAMLLGSVTFASEVHGIRAILLGFDQESNPLCLVATSYAIRSLSLLHRATYHLACFGAVLALSCTVVGAALLPLLIRMRPKHHLGKGLYGYKDDIREDMHSWDYDASKKESADLGDEVHYRKTRQGLWAIRGNRHSSLNVILLDNGSLIRPCYVRRDHGIRLKMEPVHSSVGFRWQVDLTLEQMTRPDRKHAIKKDRYLLAMQG